MGKRGPAPKPTNLRVLHGDRSDRINSAEPKPSTTDVVPPAWLSEAGLAVWEQYAPELLRTGVLTAWDVEAFAAWCDAVVRRARAVQALEDEGDILELPVYDKNGKQSGVRLGRNPWAMVLRDADAVTARIGARFGMTPSDRSQLQIGGPQRAPGDDLLSG